MPNSCHFWDCQSTFGHKFASCKECYSKHWTLHFLPVHSLKLSIPWAKVNKTFILLLLFLPRIVTLQQVEDSRPVVIADMPAMLNADQNVQVQKWVLVKTEMGEITWSLTHKSCSNHTLLHISWIFVVRGFIWVPDTLTFWNSKTDFLTTST